MIVALSAEHLARLADEMGRAGSREIGGVLVGEHLGGERFALLDFSVQRRGGGRAHFRRDPAEAAAFVDACIASRGGDPVRVNYLGEWHSHPGCAAVPSSVDVAQMREIVDDPDQPALFSVLLVVGLVGRTLQMSLTLFRPGLNEEPVEVAFAALLEVAIARPCGDAGPESDEMDWKDLHNA